MMMKKGSSCAYVAGAWCLVAVVVVLSGEVQKAEGASCNPLDLRPCLPAISGSADPTPQCCGKLKEQVPCFCGYLKNPALKPYIDSPNAKRVANFCKVAIPKC